MKKMIWLTTIFVLLLVFVVPGVSALAINNIPSDVQPSLDKTKDVYGEFYAVQQFTSLKPNLNSVAMSIKNPNLKNKETIYFHLYDSEGQLTRTSTLNGLNVGDGAFVKFNFELIPDSLNQTYTFVITCPTAGSENLIALFYTDNKPDWIGQLAFEEEKVSGGISMVTYHKPASQFEVVKEIYSNWISRFLHLDSQKTK